MSRRANRHDWPSVCRPYSSRSESCSAEMSKAVGRGFGGHEFEGLLLKGADRFGRGIGPQRGTATIAVDMSEERPAMIQAARVDRHRRKQVGNRESGRVGISLGDERSGRRAE